MEQINVSLSQINLKKGNCDLIVRIISQCIGILKHYVVHSQYITILFVNCTSKKARKINFMLLKMQISLRELETSP